MAQNTIMYINALTPLHNGAGVGQGLVDNPIIRERHTAFPFIQSTSIKGALRDHFGNDEDPLVQALFGPPHQEAESHAGAVSFSDARILAFPVRSLKGAFVWVTSPFILHRFFRDVKASGFKDDYPMLEAIVAIINDSFNLAPSVAMTCDIGNETITLNGKVILEEFPKDAEPRAELSRLAEELSLKLFDGNSGYLRGEFRKKMVLLTDETFRYYTSNATEIMPNIRINDKGVTDKGSLRYTEFLPSETILYSLITCRRAREPKNHELLERFKTATVHGEIQDLTALCGDVAILEHLRSVDRKVLQIGGDETTGKGIVELRLT